MELTKNETKQINKLLPPKDGFLPDSLLRQDDIYYQLLKNQILPFSGQTMNYHGKWLPSFSPSNQYRAAAVRILNELDNFPIQALTSMHRKLRSAEGYTPGIRTQRCGWSHGVLVARVRKMCNKFLSKRGGQGSLQLPLAHALAVACLAMKLKSTSATLPAFRKFSPEIEDLQNDIMSAIWLLEDDKKLCFTEVNDLRHLLDPNAQTNKKTRSRILKLMTEYLFECADMDIIPDCLREALSFIDKRAKKVSCLRFSKEELGTEVESVLTVSSQAKQIIWDFLPECETDIDIEFAYAYLDDMLETDDEYFSDDGLEGATFPYSDDLYNQVEGFGKSRPSCLTSPFNTYNREDELESPGKLVSPLFSSCFEHEENGHRIPENRYLSIQKACDNSSTVAYHLIGGLLAKFADVKGLDLDQDDLSYLQRKGAGSSESELLSWKNADNYCSLAHVLEEEIQSKRMPSLSGSSMEKLNKIMT